MRWATEEELRGMIGAVGAKEIVITIDSCRSGVAVPDILKKHGRYEDWQGREAVMVSSNAKQFSYFTVDVTWGIHILSVQRVALGIPCTKERFRKCS
jgi:hypothetical protein